MMRFLIIAVVALAVGCAARKSPKPQAGADSPPAVARLAEARKPVWAPKYNLPYRSAKTRRWDLLHTKLDVRFDWEKQQMPAKAMLRLTPFFHPTDSLTLDAKGFQLNKIDVGGAPVQYRYDSLKLYIKLNRLYKKGEMVELNIDYVARPEELPEGGSEAIHSDKGLYFINPLGEDANKPRQIWTQCEPEAASAWFPTIESTNERTTQEMRMTVPDEFVTLSNGLMTESQKNGDGTRTDVWRMDMPHAPYLFMMAVGNFAIVKDNWRGMEVNYYVEPQYEKYARLVFGNTPEIMTVFSEKFGVPYPWKKYSQVVVRDFVSGAMENTTATVHMEMLQHDSRDHLDETSEDYISHELTHQWFGDYVTCKTWSNLPLNESFATYGEYIWKEHKYGKDAAEQHIAGDWLAYQMEAIQKREPLIRYHYQRADDLFDRHSYQKGGCVLHCLRHYLGDAAFFAGLKRYLEQNALSDVEIDELRIAFEDVSGEDLKWFFDQWFMKPGHPELQIAYDYDADKQQVRLAVRQYQDLNYMPIYKLPTQVEITVGGRLQTFPVTVQTTDTVLTFAAAAEPEHVDFDPNKTLPAKVSFDKPKRMWVHQLKNSKGFRQKQLAMLHLSQHIGEPDVDEAFLGLLDAPFHGLRSSAIDALSSAPKAADADRVNRIMLLARRDPKANVRVAAVEYLAGLATPPDAAQRLQTLEAAARDSSYRVTAKALQTLYELDPPRGVALAEANMNTNGRAVITVVADILLREKSPKARAYIAKALLESDDMYARLMLMQKISTFIQTSDNQAEDMKMLMQLAEKDGAWYVRLFAMRMLREFADTAPDVKPFIEKMKVEEKNPQLKEIYKNDF